MKKIKGKRIGAYFIDAFIISFIISLFASITFLNPNVNEVEEYEKSYETRLNEVVKENPNSILTDDELTTLQYNIHYYGVYELVIELVVTFLYFSLFQYFNKGQTIGKKLVNIKVVSKNSDKLRLSQVVIRSSIVNSILMTSLIIISVLYLEKGTFNILSYIFNLCDFGLVLACAIMFFKNEDGIGLHDLLANTMVVSSLEETDSETKIVKRRKNENRNSK